MKGLRSQTVEVTPRRWIYLPIDVKVREFDGSAALAFEAAERGWGVILGNKDYIRNRTDLPHGMQIEKKIATGAAKRISSVQALGRTVSAWCEEGLAYNNGEEYGRRKIEKSAYELLDQFFAWGRNQADDMHLIGCNTGKLTITGNPRFDLHRPEYRGVFDDKVADIQRAHGPFILVNTKFSLHNSIRPTHSIVGKWKDRGRVLTREQEEELRGWQEFHKTGFHHFVALVGDLSRRFPEHTIVVRPHPSERFETWPEVTEGLGNVRVIREGNVVEWILAADISIHNNCTTGVESYLLGKPAISFRPVIDPRFDHFLPNALSVNAHDRDEVIALVAQALGGSSLQAAEGEAERAEVARRYIANVEGAPSCARILDVLEPLDLPVQPLSFASGPLNSLTTGAKRQAKVLLDSLPGSLRRRPANPAKPVHERHRFYRSELLDLLTAMRRVTGRFENIRVAEVENYVMCVY